MVLASRVENKTEKEFTNICSANAYPEVSCIFRLQMYLNIQGVLGGIVNILGGGSMDYSQ
jgi:hypothetical protein